MTVESSGHGKGLCKQLTLKESKLAQLDNILYTWFTVVCSEGKRVTVPMITDMRQ
jgi:hypothetical protein